MTDQPTDVPGIRIRLIRGQRYLVLQVGQAVGGNASVGHLAYRTRLQPEVVLRALLNFGSNTQVVRDLYELYGMQEQFPGLAAAREELRSSAESLTVVDDRYPSRWEPAFVYWDVSMDRTIVLPFVTGFQEVMRASTAQRQRETRLTALRPVFAELDRELLEIRLKAVELESHTYMHSRLVVRAAGDVALLEALDKLLGIMLQFPKETVDPGDRADVENLRRNLNTLQDEARINLVENPVDPFMANLLREQAEFARQLRAMIEAQPFVEHMREVVDAVATDSTRTLVPVQLWRDIQDVLLMAFRALLHSPQAEAVVDAHVRPMIQAMASQPFDLTGLSAPNKPAFDAAVREVPVGPPPSSVLVILSRASTLAGAALALGGNYPGPNTLLVGIVEWAAPTLLGSVVGRVQDATRLSGWTYRFLVNSAGLSRNSRIRLIEAIDQGDLRPLRRVPWSRGFMSSTGWGAAIGIAGVVCLMAAITADTSNTVVYWANIIATLPAAVGGVAIAFQSYQNLFTNGIVRGVGGKALGAIGAAAVIVSGTITAIEESRTGDFRGMGAGIVTAASGLFSLAGFLIAAGGSTAWSGVGVILMVVGAVLGVAVGIYSFYRSITTAGSQTVFEGYINHFGRVAGPYEEAAGSRPSLRQAFETVQRGHHGVDFWDVHPDQIPMLYELGFGYEGDNQSIEFIVDEDEAFIRTRIQQHRERIARP